MSDNIIETRNLDKEFGHDGMRVAALKGIQLSVARGEFIALMGPSLSSAGSQ